MLAAKDLGHAKVGDLEVALVRHEQVLELDVSVGDTVPVQVRDAAQQLLEEAQPVGLAEVAPLHEREELALGAVLHHVVPAAVVGAEAHRVHDVRVVQAVRDAVLRLDLLDVIGLVLVLAALPELLDGVDVVRRGATGDGACAGARAARHQLHRRRRARTDQLATPARQQARADEFVVELDRVDDKVVRQARAESTRLQAGPGRGVHADRVVGLDVGHAVHARRPLPPMRSRRTRRVDLDPADAVMQGEARGGARVHAWRRARQARRIGRHRTVHIQRHGWRRHRRRLRSRTDGGGIIEVVAVGPVEERRDPFHRQPLRRCRGGRGRAKGRERVSPRPRRRGDHGRAGGGGRVAAARDDGSRFDGQSLLRRAVVVMVRVVVRMMRVVMSMVIAVVVDDWRRAGTVGVEHDSNGIVMSNVVKGMRVAGRSQRLDRVAAGIVFVLLRYRSGVVDRTGARGRAVVRRDARVRRRRGADA